MRTRVWSDEGRPFGLGRIAMGLPWFVVVGAVACSSGGGGSGGGEPRISEDLSDPVIDVAGAPGRFSMTPEEANEADGGAPPPRLHSQVTTRNHYFRLEFPFSLSPEDLLLDSSLLEPFSYLNGNLTVTDASGNAISGVAVVDGIDAFGRDRSTEAGFPVARDEGGRNRNLAFVDADGVHHSVFLFIADHDGDLSTIAAFNPKSGAESQRSALSAIHLRLKGVRSLDLDGAWKIDIGTAGAPDQLPPQLLRVAREVPDPDDPQNGRAASPYTSFRVEFDEPVVPQSVARSAALNGFPFNGNQPLPPIAPPLPNTILTATVATTGGQLFVPFDCEPINPNNLSTYRLTPLVTLPPESELTVRVHALTTNTRAVKDLSGNVFDGTSGDGKDRNSGFSIGAGPALTNIPVAPEVVYWIPSVGRGLGAIDLNGWGFTTNAPGSASLARAAIVTNAANVNLQTGIATIGSPDGQPHNQFSYPVGLGAAYGPGDRDWVDTQGDLGNPGTPMPGVNEMSSGFETLCRNSAGDVVLTGRSHTEVGTLEDLQVGEFLDLVYYDTGNAYTNESFHFAALTATGLPVITQGRNVISDPPAPNPPPLRYWLGMPALDVVVDPVDPARGAFLVEGEEVFTGIRAGTSGLQQFRPNAVNPFGPDQTLFPHGGVGPGVQSATQAYTYQARQQIGNFLYVTDSENRMLQVLNSNTMRVISSIPLPDPRGLGIASDNGTLYVSNFGDDSLSVIDVDPLSETFHTEVARIDVGRGPGAVAVQPDHEDVFVANRTGNSFSIVDPQALTVRKTIDALVQDPHDVALTGRQLPPGSGNPYGFATGVYFGYISNFGGNNVLVFESGPDGPQGIGYDNILGSLPTGDQDVEILEPRGLCYSPFNNDQGFNAGGVFVAHRDELGAGVVSHIQFTNQAIYGPLPRNAPPGFFIPPGFLDRSFEVVGRWGNTDDNLLSGRVPTTVSLADMNVSGYQGNPSQVPNFSTGLVPPNVGRTGAINSHHPNRLVIAGAIPTWLPDRMYVGFADTDTIDVLDPSSIGLVQNRIEADHGLGVKLLGTYFDD